MSPGPRCEPATLPAPTTGRGDARESGLAPGAVLTVLLTAVLPAGVLLLSGGSPAPLRAAAPAAPPAPVERPPGAAPAGDPAVGAGGADAKAPAAKRPAPVAVMVQRAFAAAVERVAPSVVTVQTVEVHLIEEPKVRPKAELKLPDDHPVPDPKSGEPEPRDPKSAPMPGPGPKGKRGPMPKPGAEDDDEGEGFLRAAEAPTTGVIVSPDGWIVTSTFNLGRNPKYVKVRLADGRELPAEVKGKDLSRGVALLKVQAAGLPVPEFVDPKDARVGQWALALGKAFGDAPAVQYGILSAKDRIMGRALQTDAALSPANYGGPLIDVRGRVLGINVPLSSEGDAVETGLYDSGIGFSVPVADVLPRMDRLKAGETLHPAFLGIAFVEAADGVEVRDVVKDGPAAKGGIRKGDRIVRVEATEIGSLARFRFEIGRRIAGDRVELLVRRREGPAPDAKDAKAAKDSKSDAKPDDKPAEEKKAPKAAGRETEVTLTVTLGKRPEP